MAKVLVVDDDPVLCSMLVTKLSSVGHETDSAVTLTSGFDCACVNNYDIIFLDVQLPDGNGLEFLSHFANVESEPEIIIVTGNGDSNGAQKAISSGAWDYIEKPHVIRDLLLPLTRALQYREVKRSKATTPVALKRDNIIGSSRALALCLDQVAHAAGSETPVLITGETGTGKELFAHAVHVNSQRASHNFVVVDCAALPDNLVESTLFGHLKGSFTGAERDNQGLVKLADQGTLFLDEVGELSFDIQKKLLRVLQERSFRQLGSNQETFSDFRIIAATNKNLTLLTQEGLFREDLLFRLRSFDIKLPPLRERNGDIPLLTNHFIMKFYSRSQSDPLSVSADFTEYMESYEWPGNVRELQQVLEEVLSKHGHGEKLFAAHLPDSIRIAGAQANLKPQKNSLTEKNGVLLEKRPMPWRFFKSNMESQYINNLMSYCQNNVKLACEVSGLSRARIYQLLHKNEDGLK